MRITIVLLCMLMNIKSAYAEALITALSSPEVKIASNFTGADVTIFGTIERDTMTVSRAGQYDIIITLMGPNESVITRKKSRFIGIWINREEYLFKDVSSFYYLLASRPLDKIASNETFYKLHIGAQNIMPKNQPSAFVDAFIRLKNNAGLYKVAENEVKLLSPVLYRADVHLPADLPIGQYKISVYLFSGGVLLSRQFENINILKTGFEQYTFSLAYENPALYGIVTIIIALMTGWLAGIIFRKD